jgi:hypothetical protein
MREDQKTAFAERQKTAAAAKAALLAKFKPKPTVVDPLFADRPAMRNAEAARLRAERAEAKAVAVQALADKAAASAAAEEALAADALDAKRGERKERKTLSKVEAKAKRDARYAARQSRR